MGAELKKNRKNRRREITKRDINSVFGVSVLSFSADNVNISFEYLLYGQAGSVTMSRKEFDEKLCEIEAIQF